MVTFCIDATKSGQIWGFGKKKTEKVFRLSPLYPKEYLFSKQFMEDLEKIYRLKKYFPNFDNPVQQTKL